MNDLLFLGLLTVIIIIIIYFQLNVESYAEFDPTVVRIRALLLPHFPELARVKLYKGDASYTINKSKIFICTEMGGETYDDNMLVYVTLHELAHTLCESIGHTDEFATLFDNLLLRAEKVGVFDPYKPRVENYCKRRN